MTSESPLTGQFVILADESASWKIAGLSQLDRLLLALNEWASGDVRDGDLSAVIFWGPGISSGMRQLPDYSRIKRVRISESLSSLSPDSQVLSTRLFVDRKGLGRVLQTVSPAKVGEPVVDPGKTWSHLFEKFEATCRGNLPALALTNARYLDNEGDVDRCEREFLARAGKSQDGLVSRFLNRPISRIVTRRLLRLPIKPTAWTMAIFILPVVAFLFLRHGTYAGIVTGAALFQLYSILDGCDGEIARAKYLESTRGGRIDDLLDMVGSLLFVVGLGLGLAHGGRAWYAWEGFLCAAAILLNETILRFSPSPVSTDGSSAERTPQRGVPTSAGSIDPSLYPRHRGMIQNSGLLALGEKNAWWLIQFTKRDVAILVFLLLAIANLPPWILHLWITVSLVTIVLTLKGRVRRVQVAPDSTA